MYKPPFHHFKSMFVKPTYHATPPPQHIHLSTPPCPLYPTVLPLPLLRPTYTTHTRHRSTHCTTPTLLEGNRYLLRDPQPFLGIPSFLRDFQLSWGGLRSGDLCQHTNTQTRKNVFFRFRTYILTRIQTASATSREMQSVHRSKALSTWTYGVATISRLLKIMGLFCKRVL